MTSVIKRGPIGGPVGPGDAGSSTSTVRQDRNEVLSQIAAQLKIAIAGKVKDDDESSDYESSSESLYSDSDSD